MQDVVFLVHSLLEELLDELRLPLHFSNYCKGAEVFCH